MKYLNVLHHNRTQKQFIHKHSIPNFFETLQRFAKLLLWVIWECFIMLISYHSITLWPNVVPKVLKSTCRQHWFLFPCKKSTSSLTSFFEMLYRHCKLAILGTLEMLDHLHQNHSINLSKFSYVSACKKSTSSLTSFLRYCREIANFLFWVIWACLATHIKNDSITLKKRLTIISREKSTPSFTFSLRYCKDIIKLLFWVLWACLVMHIQSDTINL